MKKEIIRQDCNGDDVYLKIIQGEYVNDLLKCYAYRKIEKNGFFGKRNVYVPIQEFESDLMDKRCTSCCLISQIDLKSVEESLENDLIKTIMYRINNSITKEKHYKEALKLIFD
jgi:hypothetical protein